MRTSQPAEEKRRWPEHFLGLLRELDPTYDLSRHARGVRTECIRAGGPWFYSQSTLCVRGEYSHCFCLLLTPLPQRKSLGSVFQAGGRLDSNYTIAHAFERDLGLSREQRPKGIHSTHQWRRGTDAIVRSVTANAEEHLAPFYSRAVAVAAPELLALLDAYERGVAEPSEDRAFYDLSILDLANSAHPWHRLPEPVRYARLVSAQRERFEEAELHLAEIRLKLESLARAGTFTA